MTESDRPGDRPWPAPTGDADWWRGDGDDFPVSPAGPLPTSADLIGPALIDEARIDPALVNPARPGVILDAELVDTGSADEPADRDDELADPGDVVDGELLESVNADLELGAGDWIGGHGAGSAGPRPFDAAPRTLARPTPAPSPPARPPAPVPMLGPVPAPAILPTPREADPPGQEVAVHTGLPGPTPVAAAGVPGQRRTAVPPAHPAGPPRGSRRPAHPRRPWLGLPSLIVLALAAAFFGWVSAEPFWLAVGHGRAGTATVLASAGHCRASFVADGGAFTASTVDLSGVDRSTCAAGTTLRARMVSAGSDRAYAVGRAGLAVRVGLGYGLVLLCGLLIAWATGAARFRGWRRLASVALSVAAPLTLAATLTLLPPAP